MNSTPVYVTPFKITEPIMVHWDMIELKHSLQDIGEPLVVLYSAPYILRAPDGKRFISIWGEVFDGKEWKIMPLHANSTSIEKIIESSFLGDSEPNWTDFSSAEQPLISVWQKLHMADEMISRNANEVLKLKPDNAHD